MVKTASIAIAFGVVAVVLIAFAIHDRDTSVALVITAVVYMVLGFMFGWFRRSSTWLWGLVIATPLMSVLIFSMLFTGIFAKFWSRDMPIILATLLAPCIGVFLANKINRN